MKSVSVCPCASALAEMASFSAGVAHSFIQALRVSGLAFMDFGFVLLQGSKGRSLSLAPAVDSAKPLVTTGRLAMINTNGPILP